MTVLDCMLGSEESPSRPPSFPASHSWVAPVSSSPDFAQSVVRFWIRDDGLNRHDGFVDLGLQLAEFFYMQQAEDLSGFVENGIWGGGKQQHGPRVEVSSLSEAVATVSLWRCSLWTLPRVPSSLLKPSGLGWASCTAGQPRGKPKPGTLWVKVNPSLKLGEIETLRGRACFSLLPPHSG